MPRFIVDSSGNVVVLPRVQKKISRQKRVTTVIGFDNNPRTGRNGVPTNIFLIQGTQSPSMVPTNLHASPP